MEPCLPSVDVVSALFQQSLQTYCHFEALDRLLTAPTLTLAKVASEAPGIAAFLRDAASQYHSAASQAGDFFGAKTQQDTILLSYLDVAQTTPERLQQIRDDLVAAARQARLCASEAERLFLAGVHAPWPSEPAELWDAPLALPEAALAVAPANAVSKAQTLHACIQKTLSDLAHSTFPEAERRSRREAFLRDSCVVLTRCRWEVLAAASRGRHAELLRAVKSGCLQFGSLKSAEADSIGTHGPN